MLVSFLRPARFVTACEYSRSVWVLNVGKTKSNSHTMVVSYGFCGSIGLAPAEETGGAAVERCGTSTDIDDRMCAGSDN